MGDMVEPLEVMRMLRTHLVETGNVDPAHMMIVQGLKDEDNVFGLPKDQRTAWSEGLDVKDVFTDKTDVMLHVGCRLSYDRDQWPVIRGVIRVLQDAGVDVGIAKKEEQCCGGRAGNCGFQGELENYAESMKTRVKTSGAKTVVTPCADCYGCFKHLYPKTGQQLEDVEVLHMAELMDRLLAQGRIHFTHNVPIKVTYHDPCNLGRTGQSCEAWKGKKTEVLNKMVIREPAKEVSYGAMGIYQEPRTILHAIPGLELVEMQRIKGVAYCSGGGGGAMEAHPDFALFTARQRLAEARSTGAQAIVTACPWSLRTFRDALEADGVEGFAAYDITELVMRGLGIIEGGE
jgi:Fe-S oxidoreductase